MTAVEQSKMSSCKNKENNNKKKSFKSYQVKNLVCKQSRLQGKLDNPWIGSYSIIMLNETKGVVTIKNKNHRSKLNIKNICLL